jgi:periplasmic protein CpxP/Spy
MILSLCFCLAVGSGALAQTQSQTSEERLSRLHDSLNLSAAEEPAWRDYVAALASNQQAPARRRATQELLPQLTTPRRIALIDATMQQDLADLHREGQAVLTFYNRLTPDQQRIFDRDTMASASDQSPH